jgi:hypothetical protein
LVSLAHVKANKRKARTRGKSKPPQRVEKTLVEPMQHASSTRTAPAAEPMFSALEEAFFAAGTELSTVASAPVETFADLDAGHRPRQGFWRRLFARREPARWSPSNALV